MSNLSPEMALTKSSSLPALLLQAVSRVAPRKEAGPKGQNLFFFSFSFSFLFYIERKVKVNSLSRV